MSILSKSADVMMTEKHAMRLTERVRRGDLFLKDMWRTSKGEQSFLALLERCPDLSDEGRTDLKWKFYDAVSEW